MIFFCCMGRSDKVLLVEQAEYFQPNGHVLNRITSVQVSDRTNAEGQKFTSLFKSFSLLKSLSIIFFQTNKLLFTINKETDVCNTSPSNSSLVFLNSNTVITPNVWYAVAVSLVNGVQRIYLNGQLIAATPTPAAFRNCSNAPFYFGIWWLQDLRAYMGRLDNIRIYNRALSELEVKYLSDNYK